ncbi:MAG: hypothetical protein QM715_15695 [Nibricoccus sp.]
MKSLSLKAKLVGSIVIPMAVVILVIVLLSLLAGSVRTTVHTAKERGLQSALLVKGMQLHTVQVQQFLSDVSATRGLDGLDDGFKLMAELRAAMNDMEKSCNPTPQVPKRPPALPPNCNLKLKHCIRSSGISIN